MAGRIASGDILAGLSTDSSLGYGLSSLACILITSSFSISQQFSSIKLQLFLIGLFYHFPGRKARIFIPRSSNFTFLGYFYPFTCYIPHKCENQAKQQASHDPGDGGTCPLCRNGEMGTEVPVPFAIMVNKWA